MRAPVKSTHKHAEPATLDRRITWYDKAASYFLCGLLVIHRRPQRLLLSTKMLALINRLLDWFRSLFWKEEMELTLVGLQYSGKTTFVNVIAVSDVSYKHCQCGPSLLPAGGCGRGFLCMCYTLNLVSTLCFPSYCFRKSGTWRHDWTVLVP